MNLETTEKDFFVGGDDVLKGFYTKKEEIPEIVPSVKELIDEFLSNRALNNKHRGEPFYFHPSTILKNGCQRKVQYKFCRYAFKEDVLDKILEKDAFQLFGKKIENAAKLKRIFDNGNSVHDRYAEYFDKMGILVEEERPLYSDKYRIKGFADDIITIKDEEYIIEMKSMNTMQASKLQKPVKDHEIQLQFYMYLTGIHKGFVVYEDKNNQNIIEFYLTYDEGKIEYILKRIEDILEATYKDELMPKKMDKCTKCPYREYCKEEIKISKLLKNKINWSDFSEIKTED